MHSVNLSSLQAVTFDFGQTLAELDTVMLKSRLLERNIEVNASNLEVELKAAWKVYNDLIAQTKHPWKQLMHTLLMRSGVDPNLVDEMVDWLWLEQPKRNLWRKPISGMIDLVLELKKSDIKVAIISNSEGGLVQLVDEMGWTGVFDVIADSGSLHMEKPGREIFQWTAEQLRSNLGQMIHVGDLLAADVQGALQAGMKAVWYQGNPNDYDHPFLECAQSVEEVRESIEKLSSRLI